ncbi:hypothetical protein NQ317_014419 [Molorchus minor]|uniref:Transmembrane protein 267 n=1 Tax=Molorchus minor TaxID=1323400 RepID=A0ABQ9K6X1_9CUCU|nr:hypothetical protein NQ317_014419 [Molorchus minor]
MFYRLLFNSTTYLTILLALVAIVGDYIVYHTKLHFFQALFDNTTHALIGALSWFMVCLHFKSSSAFYTLLEVAACAFVASLIDLDHFVAARSLNFEDATNLKQRPPLHCSTFPLVICLPLLMLSYVLYLPSLKRSILIVLTAFVSHHTRDATRRGFWLYPYGSTPPIPYGIYVLITCMIPHLIRLLYTMLKKNDISVSYDF